MHEVYKVAQEIARLDTSTDGRSHEEIAQEILAQFDRLSINEKRQAVARVFGIDPDRTVIVRKGDRYEVQEVPAQQAETLKLQAKQGYKAVAYTNRKQRRAAAAQARHGKR